MRVKELKNIQMIDTHCHLSNPEFQKDIDVIVKRASELGIAIISSSIEKEEWDSNLSLSQKYDSVFSSTGLDPENWSDIKLAEQWIRKHSEHLVSIGENGLDYYRTRDHAERELQRNAFIDMIYLSKELEIPIQVHSRSAGKAAIEVLEQEEATLVHLHAFDGKASLARMASNDFGYYFSIPTSVVRSPQKQKLVKAVSIERLLIETDSPVLAPERGMRNTPLNLPIVIQEISKILRRDEEEIQSIILENTLRLYTRIRF